MPLRHVTHIPVNYHRRRRSYERDKSRGWVCGGCVRNRTRLLIWLTTVAAQVR
jgi:hypothetical protein